MFPFQLAYKIVNAKLQPSLIIECDLYVQVTPSVGSKAYYFTYVMDNMSN